MAKLVVKLLLVSLPTKVATAPVAALSAPAAKVLDVSSENFDKLLGNLASANIAAKIQQNGATDVLPFLRSITLL